jgi:hypothetical protein
MEGAKGMYFGYVSNSHTYRANKNMTSQVQESCNMRFDENNGSQVGAKLI